MNTIKTLNTAEKCNDFFTSNIFNDDNLLKIPIDFANLIDAHNPHDPLLKQVFLNNQTTLANFTSEPLGDSSNSPVKNLIHKYHNRALLITTSSCEIFCRYCFRQNFPYSPTDILKNWEEIENYLQNHTEINEVILSGGDPLSLSDEKLASIFENIYKIQHIKTIRIHSRTFSIIRDRITPEFVQLINTYKKNIIIVSHINHPNEITPWFTDAIRQLNCQILNQSVLLKGVNDTTNTLIQLSNDLWDIGILPYYLHMLDKVSGCEDYAVDDMQARSIYLEMQKQLSGYLVPRLVRDENKEFKTPIASL
jgi:EF-P beta-lysylation protein EpmB